MQTEPKSVLAVTSFEPLELNPLLPEINLSKLLRFPLGLQDSGLLPLEQIAEISRVNLASILPIPEMPSCILGICHWRGEMLWLLDLNHLIGYPHLTMQATPVAIVVKVNEQAIGLVVPQVDDIESYDLQQLQKAAPGLFPPKLLPFVLGALPNGNIVLDVTAITQYPLWQIHRTTVS
ncbi:MAG: chemotaxis protein CheW [Brasilonema octagenarum HA4186-MV1]|jgi:positive phototaxis protein PixI|uniref:Chemotaxis protein CheW n=1 Tax=Brasilonema octagenarum UFV-OR1 TaxID=417115 RepID=A0ABX1M7K5_9CYAN|nr:chemotaxis protein CheW [Brasilonema octagenarum]MBW4626026.1 chemotaxis protein CheW [Brasilonema octagenarum HA4186-MV1]NMF63433.1 chemotaxis protein CheW [Brasilonema octagenarum UFV-OR1]